MFILDGRGSAGSDPTVCPHTTCSVAGQSTGEYGAVSLWEETESEPSTLDVHEAFEQSASSQRKFLTCLLNNYKVEGF